MQLLTWSTIEKLANKTTAEKLGLTHTEVYNYSHGLVIPRLIPMLKIVAGTRGFVMPNDFYKITKQFVTKVLKEPYFLEEVLRNPTLLDEIYKE